MANPHEKFGWRLIHTALMLIERERAEEQEILNASCFLFAYLAVKLGVEDGKIYHMLSLRIMGIREAQEGVASHVSVGDA